jgi:NTP pyrophosphatase (non-canonical NTP hydrolase)
MKFEEIVQKALYIREKYAELEIKLYGEEWSREEIALGFVGDVGELMQYVVANEGKRDKEDKEAKLAYELSDCLWSILVLANKYNIDLEKAFNNNMAILEKDIENRLRE